MSDAIGCPLEFIVFPLLTFAAACMGVNLCSCGHQWDVERTSHHLVHCSLKGQKKTAAFRLLKKPFEETEYMEAEKWRRQQNNLQPQAPTTHFSFEELHHVMKRNGPQILELFDELSTMYSQLDLYKQSGSVMDRKTLITLNGGSSWSRNYQNYTASIKQTAFNMSGFIQPFFVERCFFQMMLMVLAFCAPSTKRCTPGWTQAAYSLKYSITQKHLHFASHDSLLNTYLHVCVEWWCTGAYMEYHDKLVCCLSQQVDGNIQGILSKAWGYTARLAMILFALEQTLSHNWGWMWCVPKYILELWHK